MSRTTRSSSFCLLVVCGLSLLSSVLGAPDQFCATGCASGQNRSAPFEDGELWPTIAVCDGIFDGYISGAGAQSLCARGWHVCSVQYEQDRVLLKSLTEPQTRQPAAKCYALDASDDFDTCKPCTGNVHEDDMVAVGGGCQGSDWSHNNYFNGGCFAPGAVNDLCCHGYLSATGCQYVAGMGITGVTCCANNFADPCFDSDCPADCCDHGVCDRSTGTCSCLEGYSGPDCCTSCNEVTDCEQCIAETTCVWCTRSRACTRLEAPACLDYVDNTTFCVVDENVVEDGSEDNTVAIIGGTVGGVVAGLIALLLAGAIAALILGRYFTRGEYAEMWSDFVHGSSYTSPLYEQGASTGTSALYVDKTDGGL